LPVKFYLNHYFPVSELHKRNRVGRQ